VLAVFTGLQSHELVELMPSDHHEFS
jgi:hypothetical protein